MKTLISIPWFSPAFKAGGPIQSILNMVNNCDDNIKFKILTENTDIDKSKLENINSDTWSSFNASTEVFYVSPEGRVKKLKKQFKTIKSDVVFIVGIYSFYFTLLPLLFSRATRIIISVRGMLHPPALQQKKLKKKIYLALLKPLLKFKDVEFHATDQTESDYIHSYIGKSAKVWVAPNIPAINTPNILPKKSGKLTMLTVALIGPMKNYHEVLNSLHLCKYEIQYDICGPIYVSDYWDECMRIIEKLPSNIKVNYHGAVPPHLIGQYLFNTHIFVCPSQSENFGHAIYEAFSAGKPVITSHNTPWNNLEDNFAGINLFPETLSIKKAIDIFCEMNDETYAVWSKGASDFSKKAIDLDSIKNKNTEMFAAI